MNVSRLVGGIVCLAIAGLLAVLNVRLPPEDIMFQIGGTNMPWVPVAVLGVVGVFLLATAARGGSEQAREAGGGGPERPIDQDKVAMNKRLETVGWGLFLVMLGGFALVPNEQVPSGWWSIGVGLIFLGLNAARYFNGIRMSGFTTFLGLIALLGGIAELIWKTSLEGALLLILLGAYLLLKPWFDKRQLFGKAEES
jgi:hypothetical protein